MRFSPRTLIILSGLIWLGIGLFLLTLGSSFILKSCNSAYGSPHFSLALYLSRTMKDPGQSAVILLSSALFLGYLKGRFVLSKAVNKQVLRLLALPRPIPLKSLYTLRYYILIGGMVGLGTLLRYLPISIEFRGIIDVAIGMALISGALQYIRQAFMPLSPLTSKQDEPS